MRPHSHAAGQTPRRRLVEAPERLPPHGVVSTGLSPVRKRGSMKRKITLSLALVLLLSLSAFAPAARGQQQRAKVAFDTGIVTLDLNQILRITVNGQGGNDTVAVAFRRLSYSQGACNGGVCRLALNDEDQFPALTLPPGDAASFDIHNTAFGVRGVVLSGSQNVRVTAQIIDTSTGDVIAIWVPQGSPAVGKE